jgi:diguanylate cyclase (GGDEF)-like protein
MSPARAVLLRLVPAAALVAYAAWSGHDGLRRTALALAICGCLGVAAVALAAGRPLRPGVWALLLAAYVAMGAGDVLATVDEAVPGSVRPLEEADLPRLLAYVLLAAGLSALAGRRHPLREGGTLLDAAIVATATATVAGVFLVLPAADGEGTAAERALACAYPVAGVLTLAVLARLVTTRGARTPAFHLLTASVVAMVLAAPAATVADRATGGDLPRGMEISLELLGLAGYLLFAMATLHPSMRTLSDSARDGAERLTVARLTALGAAMLLTPATLLVQAAGTGERHTALVAVGSVGVIVLVLVRIRGLLAQVEAQAAQLDRLARADSLTGLPNRRSWDFELARSAAKARQQGQRLVVALLDLDHFKVFNDTYGHQAGDALLRSCATAWREALGSRGTLARYGGEEFAIAMPANLAEAVSVLDRLRAVTPDGQTFSAGAAEWDFISDPAEAVARADAALYAAKRAGRNRVVAAPASELEVARTKG